MFTFLVLAISALTIFRSQIVFGHGYVEIELKKFENEHHLDSSRKCCDGLIRCGYCDTYLDICATYYTRNAEGTPDCNLGKIVTESFATSTVIFSKGQALGKNLKNPIRMRFDKWQTFLQLQIEAHDHDWLSANDVINYYSITVILPLAANSSVAQPSPYMVKGSVSELQFNVRIYCDDKFQSDDCSQPTNA